MLFNLSDNSKLKITSESVLAKNIAYTVDAHLPLPSSILIFYLTLSAVKKFLVSYNLKCSVFKNS